MCRQQDPDTKRCGIAGCGRYYHLACLTGSLLWPQTRVLPDAFYCPVHTCHTCASDNPK